MSDLPLLSILMAIPLLGAVGILVLNRGDEETVAARSRHVALLTSGVTFVVSLALWFGFDRSTAAFQFVENVDWVPELGIGYRLGVDGFSVLFILLSTLLTPICILASWKSITKRVREYMVAFLVLETLMIGTFSALDLVLFYSLFEAVLIPMFLIIGVWGGPRRLYASYKFFLYTLAGSVLMLVALIAILFITGTSDISALVGKPIGEAAVSVGNINANAQNWLWWAFFAAFAVKMPMWPVHTWLPDAHVEAPTGGSVILAGVLLKMGGYGFLRLSLPLLPEASATFAGFVFVLSIIAIIYTSLVALVQDDMKKVIAYSSVAHMGYVTLGLFTMNTQGVDGAIFQMLSHGVISGALFLIVGVVYDQMHTRVIARFGGVVEKMPKYAIVFMLMMMASVGLPGTGGFVGEFLVLLGSFKQAFWVGALAATGIILGAPYMLLLYRRVVFGAIQRDEIRSLKDLSPRDMTIFAPLVVMVLWMGLLPGAFLDFLRPSSEQLVTQYCRDVASAGIEWRGCIEPGVEATGRPDEGYGYGDDKHGSDDKYDDGHAEGTDGEQAAETSGN